jgi:hypothetical protein
MKRHALSQLAATLFLTAATSSASAHHSYALYYDLCQSVTIEGRVGDVQWTDPHVWITLTMDDGTTYHAEWTSLRGLTNTGVAGPAKDALTAGARVAVTGSPVRDPALIRANYPARKGEPAPRIVSALTQVRRAGDGWGWVRRSDSNPQECSPK